MSDQPPKVTVLVVEDEALLRELLVEELDDAGFAVVAAEDGDAALAVIESGCGIDVLFTDIRLPGSVDGWQVATAARAKYPEIQVIYASGYTVERAAQVPGSLYLSKPYLPSAVIEQIGVRPKSGTFD